MLTRSALVLVLGLLASCTVNPVPAPSTGETQGGGAPSEPTKWTEIPPITVLGFGVGKQMAGWRNGYLVAEPAEVPQQYRVVTTKDGRVWRTPKRGAEMIAASCCGRMVAGYGAAGYVLGWTAGQELAVRRTEDGETWETTKLQLAGIGRARPLDFSAVIAAGPRGVIVVGSNSTIPPAYDGSYVWYSPDGRSFGRPIALPDYLGARAEATPTGFLINTYAGDKTALLESEDGRSWHDITANFPRDVPVEHLAGNQSTVVAFVYQPSPRREVAWYLRDGAWRLARVDPGALPDAGVVPADKRRVNAVRLWGAGFLAIGNTFAEEGQSKAGMVWYSSDGSFWIRMPVRQNGFDRATELMDVAISGRRALLIGYPSDNSDKHLLWQAETPV